ncbi:MAG: thiamine pyrophosphate-dependent dehydrogenase E1 component subunit alpha, partial [Chloroflexi bacterium]|nr:thiamine pyrophosphate-dependent dehydrogenase E1 component subunit alpha [Chloroflexota bacterium]
MVTRRNDSVATETAIPYQRESVPHADLPLADQELLDMYYYLLLARGLDDRMWLLNRQGKANFVISCNGHEASQVGTAWALRPGVDWVYPYYRDLGVILPLGMTPREVMLAVFARADDPSSGGRQMAGHWGKRDLKIVSVSSPVGTQIPQAAGTAYASKLFGSDEVTAVYFGEGTTSQGDFHEGLNFASIHRLPVVFICENNAYAISTPQRLEMAVGSVADRAPAYGMPGVSVDGNDVLA